MNFAFASGEPARGAHDLLIVPLFAGELRSPSAALDALGNGLPQLVRAAAGEEGFTGKADQSFVFHTQAKAGPKRVLLLGLGDAKRYRTETLRLCAGKAAKLAGKLRQASGTFALPQAQDAEASVRAVVEGLLLGDYRYLRYRTTNKDEQAAPRLKQVKLLLPSGVARSKALDQAVTLGRVVAEATNWARDRVNEPAGELTPGKLAGHAQALAKEHGLEAKVVGRREIEKLKMGMFLGVAQGSVQEPKLIHVRYTPKNPKDAKKPMVALVGKAITFDSGGLSLKSAEGMLDMKTDMAGSAAVLGAMRVVAHLKPPFPVHAFIGTCENMPSGTSYRPGDVLTSRLGKTVEVTNTDAEGRLVLGDVLAWAAENKPAALIDLATLTGACIVALGNHVTGAFGEDEPLMAEVLEAARAAGEELWRLPIHELQKDALRSEIADMKNSGERWGGAINAAVFLSEFVGQTPWVHLDIAGPSVSPKERGYLGKGPTGAGVRTLVELIRQRAQA
jgi:leucyl aminopeptidase